METERRGVLASANPRCRRSARRRAQTA
jgi:hypothetical protein